jgi:hypothetical protein
MARGPGRRDERHELSGHEPCRGMFKTPIAFGYKVVEQVLALDFEVELVRTVLAQLGQSAKAALQISKARCHQIYRSLVQQSPILLSQVAPIAFSHPRASSQCQH